MQSPNRAFISSVDELRGAAALLVFFFHANILSFWAVGHEGWPRAATPFEALLYEGHTGVALFMVLSGFILAKGVIGREIRYGSFVRNRILRIAPLTIVVTVFAVSGTREIGFGQVFAPVLLVQNLRSLALTDPAGLSGTLWTISPEFQFYLIAPFLFAFVARDGIIRFLLPAALLAFVLKLMVLASHRADPAALWSIPYFTIVGRLDQFLFGIGLAALWPRTERLDEGARRRLALLLLAAGSLGALGLGFAVNRGGGQYAWHPWRYAHQELEGLVWATFIAGYVLLDPLARRVRLRQAAAAIGLVSFSLYVLHWPVLALALRVLPRLGLLPDGRLATLAIAAFLILPAALGLAALSYWTVERPFLRSRSRYVDAAPEPPAPSGNAAG